MPGDTRCHFVNPLNGGDYSWDTNYTTMDAFGKTRTITHSGSTTRANSTVTTNTGLVKQQGDDSPMVLKLKGTIQKQSQHSEFIAFWQLCNSQTIYFIDFDGDKYEVIITAYEPIKKGVAKNPRDSSINFHVYEYELDLEVVTILAGPWVGVTP